MARRKKPTDPKTLGQCTEGDWVLIEHWVRVGKVADNFVLARFAERVETGNWRLDNSSAGFRAYAVDTVVNGVMTGPVSADGGVVEVPEGAI
jgi:hypothetical protein